MPCWDVWCFWKLKGTRTPFGPHPTASWVRTKHWLCLRRYFWTQSLKAVWQEASYFGLHIQKTLPLVFTTVQSTPSVSTISGKPSRNLYPLRNHKNNVIKEISISWGWDIYFRIKQILKWERDLRAAKGGELLGVREALGCIYFWTHITCTDPEQCFFYN